MKITLINSSLLSYLLLLGNCEFPLNQEPALEDPCEYLTYQPPDTIPGATCENPCTYVYQGEVNFATGTLHINCQERPLATKEMKWYIDPEGFPVYKEGDHWPAIFIEAANWHDLCSWDLAFQYLGETPFSIQYLCTCGTHQKGGYRIVPPPSFWEGYDREKASFTFRFTATAPIINEDFAR